MNPLGLVHLLAQTSDVPPSFWPVVLPPALMAGIGFVIFAAFFEASLSKRRSFSLRHVGTALIAVGLLVSLRTLSQLLNPDTGVVYRASILSKYTFAAHYAVPGLLVAILIGIGFGEAYLNKALPS